MICVMSGCFVQRGEAAIADPYLRAEALLCAGADAVLELPFPYSACGAEFFCRAGVDILERLGVDELWFGSECGTLSVLRDAARVAASEDFLKGYADTADTESGTAQAYFALLQQACGLQAPICPNDILGIAYLRAIELLGAQIRPVTVKRQGSGYHARELTDDGAHPSATALRKLWREEGLQAVLPHLPQECREVYARADEPFSLQKAERLVLGHFRLTAPERLCEIAELTGGLGNRLAEAAEEADSLETLLARAATKKYTRARMQRGILFALTGVLPQDMRARPSYVRLLAANRLGCLALRECRRDADIAVVTRKADLPAVPNLRRAVELEERAWSLYALCREDQAVLPSPWRRQPIIRD